MNIKAHNEADVRHCSSDLCKATIVIGTDIWARVSTSNHCTVGDHGCAKNAVFFFSSSSWTSYLQEIPATIRPQKFIWILQLLRDPRILHRVETRQFERLKHLPWVYKVHKHYTIYTLVVYSRVLELSCHLHVTVLLNNVQYFTHLMLWNIAYVYSQFIKKP